MPFIRHIDYGPDKMEGHWVGAFMRGPLVMAATGISTWDEATVDADHDLCSFIPDYDGDQHLTHYFRLRDDSLSVHNEQLRINNEQLNDSQLSTLQELLLIAKSRADEQQAWEALAVKVPEYAPWAKHGYARMIEQLKKAQSIMDAPKDKYSQEEIDNVVDALNAVINTMRPGNLAEVEDLEELKQLVDKAKSQLKIQVSGFKIQDSQVSTRQLKTNSQLSTPPRERMEGASQLSTAIDYANMVIRYVTDGSGTYDMIERATKQLKEL